MPLNVIVATDLNNGIGFQNKLLCYLPADLEFFKKTTMGHPIVMGRKTFQSIGRVLPGRQNIIISAHGFQVEGAMVFSSLEHFKTTLSPGLTYFIIGGASLYRQTLMGADTVYRTLIRKRFEADVFFPELSENGFSLVSETEGRQDEKNTVPFSFQIWKPK